MKRKFKGGLTSVSLAIFVADTSSTTGSGLSGVTSASSGLILEYRRAGQSTWTSVTPQSGKTLGSYLSGGIVADGSVGGAYEVDFPDAAFASGARVALCRIRGVANMLPVLIEIELDAVDYQDAVRFGLTSLPNVAQGTNGALPTGNSSGQVTVGTNSDKTGYTATVSDKTGFSLLATTGLGNQTANITGNLSGSVGSVTGAVGSVTAAVAVSDKTGFKLASDGLALVTAWTVGITGNITGNVTGSVGSISGVSFPTNFASLGISASGYISRVVLVDTTTNNTDMRGTDGAALASAWTATRAGYLDGVLLATNYNQRTVHVTGSNYVAADIHELQSGVITAGDFAANWLTAAGLAADAATEIATAVGTLQVLTRLGSMIEADGAGWQYTASALDQAPAGGGGANTINVYPVSASTPERVAGTTITYYRSEIRSVSVVTDFTLTSLTLVFVIEDAEGTDLLSISNGSISRFNQTFTVSIGTAVTSSVGNKRWALRDITGGSNSVIARGVLTVQEAASA